MVKLTGTIILAYWSLQFDCFIDNILTPYFFGFYFDLEIKN